MSLSLEQRVQRLEDLEAIRDLTARYAFARFSLRPIRSMTKSSG